MKKCKVLITFFDGKRREAGIDVDLSDAEANRHTLAGRVKIIKPRSPKTEAQKAEAKKKATAKKKVTTKKKAIAKPKPKPKGLSSDKNSAGAMTKQKKKGPAKPKKKPEIKKKKGKKGKKNA